MTPAEQAAVDFVADQFDDEATAVERAKSRETAEFYFRDIPEAERQTAILSAAARVVAEDIRQRK